MNLQQRIDLLVRLREYMLSDDLEWKNTKQAAYIQNAWFLPEFIELSVNNICYSFLNKEKLLQWTNQYQTSLSQINKKTVGVVMAGNIPLVGFHDFLCVFISGHRIAMKLSSKDEILFKHLVKKLTEWSNELQDLISLNAMLISCDAYIATGSNNSGRYFEYYFGKYKHIIRCNRTSAAVLNGKESTQDFEFLADDIFQYFGRGCRNVTKLYVPESYDFLPLMNALKRYNYLQNFSKYQNNIDYQLAILILNNKLYMNSGALLLTENTSFFSPLACIYYEFYSDKNEVLNFLNNNTNVQCVVGANLIPFGTTQQPSLNDYADGKDTMKFLLEL